MAHRTLTDARKRLLEALKRTGPTTAGDLARHLGMTVVAARQHLLALENAGRVRQQRRPADGRGRPSMIWSVSDPTDPVFPDRHGDLTVNLIDAVREAFGDRGLDQVIAIRALRQTEQYKKLLPGGRASLKARVQALAAQRSAEGYMAEVVREKPGSYLLIEHHCPVCAAARCCTRLCTAELDVFRLALGPGVHIERTAHLLSGDDRCVYRIRRAPDSSSVPAA